MSSDIISFVINILISFLNIYSIILIVSILLTWFRGQDWADRVYSLLSPVTDPYLNVFRSFIPPLGMIDISPILALLVLQFAQNLLAALAPNVGAMSSVPYM